MSKQIDLDELDRATAEATEGPWEADDNQPFSRELQGIFAPNSRRYVLKVEFAEQPDNPADVTFIAEARTAVPALIAELRQARAAIERVRELHRRAPVFEHEDSCPDTSDEHRGEHHNEDSNEAGEYYCDQLPDGAICRECSESYQGDVEWPCPTIQVLDSEETRRSNAE